MTKSTRRLVATALLLLGAVAAAAAINCDGERDTDVRGGVASPAGRPDTGKPASTPQECCDKCNKRGEECSIWTFKADGAVCSLYSSAAGKTEGVKGVTYGSKVQGTGRDAPPSKPTGACAGEDSTAPVGAAGAGALVRSPSRPAAFEEHSSEACCAQCMAAQDCSAWSYETEKRQCSLWKQALKTQPQSHSVFGRKPSSGFTSEPGATGKGRKSLLVANDERAKTKTKKEEVLKGNGVKGGDHNRVQTGSVLSATTLPNELEKRHAERGEHYDETGSVLAPRAAPKVVVG